MDRCNVIAMAKHSSYTVALKLNVVDALCSYFTLEHETRLQQVTFAAIILRFAVPGKLTVVYGL